MGRIVKTFMLIAAVSASFILFQSCSRSISKIDKFQSHDNGWSMFRNNPSGGSADVSLAGIDSLIWTTGFRGLIYASPVISDGLGVIPALDKRVYYFDPETGKGIGRIKTKSASSSSPAIAENLLYIASETDDGRLRCININKGREVWVSKLGDVPAPIILHDRTLLVGNYHGELFSINRFTGDQKWSFKARQGIHGGACVADEKVFFGSADGHLYCLDLSDGSLIWEYDAGSAIMTAPAADDACYVTTYGGGLLSIDKNSGELIWAFNTSAEIFSSPVLDDNAVYFGCNDRNVYAISKESGEPIWILPTTSIVASTPLVGSDLLVIGCGDGTLHFVDKFTGKITRSLTVKGRIKSSPVYFRDKIYLASTDKRMYCFGRRSADSANTTAHTP